MWTQLTLFVFVALHMVLTSAETNGLIEKLEPEYRDLDYNKEIGYYLRIVNKINKEFNEGKIEEKKIKKRNKVCGNAHFGENDAAISKTLRHLLAKPAVKLTKERMDSHTFSSWTFYHLPTLHNFTYCMEIGLLPEEK
ncbi:uncharacterized protein LOC109609420 [Aethina tumida]|uniref:uncharacterized protein LOC109609420 n=1 Tax=Aethina tumida TaxID=116153 RepID=UPI002147B380|nr:uncharacterized protein LOC109609420 [Aethina tumida]